jgi:TonB dependent receptor-like, beta-barrel
MNRHWKLRGAVTHAFRLPTFTDLYYHDPANVGSPSLKPERAWNYATGVDWYAGARFQAHLNLFERRDHNGIDYVRLAPNDVWRAANIENLTFRGASVSATADLGHYQHWEFGYAALHGSQAPLGIVQSRYLFNYLVHSAECSWHAVLPGGLVARSQWGILDRIHQTPYALWDEALARTKGRVHPFIQASNLTSTFYEEVQGVPMPGRSILIGVDLVVFSRKR